MTRTDIEDTPVDLTSERLRWLDQTRNAILSAESPYLIAHAALKYLRKLVPVQRATVAEFDLESQRASVMAAASDVHTKIRTGLLVPVETFGLPAEMRSGQVRHIKDLIQVFRPGPVDRELFLEGIRSYINVPLLAQDQLLGTINLASSRANRFSAEDIALAQEVADMLAVAILQTRYQVKDRYLQAFPRVLKSAQDQFVKAASLDELMNELLEAFRQITNYTRARIYLRDDQNEFVQSAMNEVLPEAASASSDILPAKLSLQDLAEHPLIEQVLVQQKPFRYTSTDIDAPIRSWLAFPLGVGQHLQGLVALEHAHSIAFNQEHEDIGQLLVFQAALAIENQRLMAENEAQDAELHQRLSEHTQSEREQRDLNDTLLDVMATLNSSLDLDEVLAKVLENLARVVPFDSATVLLRRDDIFHVKNSLGTWDSQETRRIVFPSSDPYLARMLESREPVCIPDVREAKGFMGYGQMKRVRSWLGVPLIPHGREVSGILSLASQQNDIYDQSHARIASTFAGQAAVAIENASLFGKARQLAVTDVLTGVHNRRYLYSYGQRELERSRRSGHEVAVILLDVDRFKDVNDTYGHSAGDRVLVELAAQCQAELRNYDIFARFGGEEFVILLPETGQDAARRVAERIRKRIEGLRLDSENGPIAITVSMGLVAVGSQDHDLEALLNRADQAMYAAKVAGRNRLAVYDSAEMS
jgi:diguanylate cyclase (GGDEF)-like protein